jgi:hypothetical protein
MLTCPTGLGLLFAQGLSADDNGTGGRDAGAERTKVYAELWARVVLFGLQFHGGLLPYLAHATEPELWQQILSQESGQTQGTGSYGTVRYGTGHANSNSEYPPDHNTASRPSSSLRPQNWKDPRDAKPKAATAPQVAVANEWGITLDGSSDDTAVDTSAEAKAGLSYEFGSAPAASVSSSSSSSSAPVAAPAKTSTPAPAV